MYQRPSPYNNNSTFNPRTRTSTSTSTRWFRQLPCPKSSVRLFRIMSLKFGDARLQLATFDLDSCPDYVALSYVWDPRPRTLPVNAYGSHHDGHTFMGRPYQNKTNPNPPWEDPEDVIAEVNGGKYRISRHLTGALHALSRFKWGDQQSSVPLSSYKPLPNPLWIYVDAICIRQDDPADKECQVANMHRIFRQASTVATWFGQAHYGSPIGRCFLEIPELVNELEACIQQMEARDQSSQRHEDDRAHQIIIPRLHGDRNELAKCLSTFCHIPWWERLWVVQEALLAQDIVMLCGRFVLPWATYIKLMEVSDRLVSEPHLSRRLHDSLRARLRRFINPRARGIQRMTSLASRAQDTGTVSQTPYEPRTTHVLIGVIQNSFVTEPLDRVYSVLALLGPEVRQMINVDYSQAAKTTYWLKWVEVCRAMILARPLLIEVLWANASYREQRPGMPSWCPNLDDNSYCPNSLISYPPPRAGFLDGIASKFQGARSDETGPWIKPVDGTNAFRVAGLSVDRVAQVVSFRWMSDAFADEKGILGADGEIPSALASMVLDALATCTQLLEEANPHAGGNEVALARTLVASGYAGVRQSSQSLLQDFQLYKAWLNYNVAVKDGRVTPVSSMAEVTPRFGLELQDIGYCTAFFITEFGRPGITSFKVKPGDNVCVLFGLSMPFVLRRDDFDTTYDLVGEAYVDGIMQGEALTQYRLDDIEVESYIIK